MPRLGSALLSGLFMCGVATAAFGQTGGPGPGAAASALSALMRENPTIARLDRVAPESAPRVAIEIIRIGSNRQQDTLKGAIAVTTAEHAQLAENPAFAKAYSLNPIETLHLLRFVNNLLQTAAASR